MRHAGTQTIETERLLLRPLTPEDAPMMYANWANDPDVTRWLRWEPHKNVDETRELLKRNGFRWSPRNSAWQRQLTANGKYAAHQVMDVLDGNA